MKSRLFRQAAAILVGAALTIPAFSLRAQEGKKGPTEGLESIYGLVVEPGGDGTLLLATQYGLIRAGSDGMSELLGLVPVAVSGLAMDPADPQRLFLSGFAETGKPAGVYVSQDGGASWRNIEGTAGEGGVALSALTVSPLDGSRLAGLADGILLSDDSGQSWRKLETTPDKTFAVALSGTSPERLFAASMGGLMISEDGGRTWQRSYAPEAPATAVATLSGGRVASFVFGVGLIMANEATLDWSVVADGFEDRYLIGLIEDPARPGTLYASVDTGAILMSRDNGRKWISFEGNGLMTPERIARGQAIFADTCQACHGVGGIGEEPGNPEARDEYGFKAPALNDDMHGWHHSDAGIRATIRKGSSRNQRMIAWQEVLSDDEIDAVLAYIKSTWSLRSTSCQGSRHMRC